MDTLLFYATLLVGILDVAKGFQCSLPNNNLRLDCFPQNGATQEGCLARGCCWAQPSLNTLPIVTNTDVNVPYCFYPSDYPNYQIVNVKSTPRGQIVALKKPVKSYLPNEIANLLLEVVYETKSRVRIRITDPNRKRFEVPIELGPPDASVPLNPEYQVIIPKNGTFSLQVKRKSDGISIFEVYGPLLFADQFLQISSLMSTNQIYGIGEQNRPFLHNLTNGWRRLGLWARDAAIETNINLYGTHPFYMGMPKNGKAFGTYFFNSNAQEFGLQPTPLVTYRTTGGILDIFFFTGGNPEMVVTQYLDLIGKPMLPPFWALGYHLCKYGYKDLNEIANVVQRNFLANVPIGTQWADIDYMDKYKDFSIDSKKFQGLGNFIRLLRQKYGIRFVVIIDPGIYDVTPGSYEPYDEGIDMNVFVKHMVTKQPLRGVVWPGEVVFPDFTHPNATSYWTKQIQRFYTTAPVDGLWIDMNEPSNFVDGSTIGCEGNSPYDNPFFTPQIRDNNLRTKTICSSALHYNNVPHYNLHNLYGYTEAVSTNHALQYLRPNQRVFILSRSTFSGSGMYTNHWTGDNFSTWEQLANSIRQILNFNMFGIPMTGADICGFIGNTTEELCIRWTQLGAFYPFMRNHNSLGFMDQDPASWSPKTTQIMSISIYMRHMLLPYYYTLLAKSHLNGSTVFRPLSFEFFNDSSTHSVDQQFMVGSALLVTPVVTQGALSVKGYFPAGIWYDFVDSHIIRSSNSGGTLTLDTPLNKINVALRGGFILPLFDPFMSLDQVRRSNFTLYCGMSKDSVASGDLYWDDGISMDSFSGNKYNYFDFQADINGLRSTPRQLFYKDQPSLKRIIILGLQRTSITKVFVNGQTVNFMFKADLALLFVDNLEIVMTSQIIVKWM